jgi:hypothetical protein
VPIPKRSEDLRVTSHALTSLLKHLQERMPDGLFVPDVA